MMLFRGIVTEIKKYLYLPFLLLTIAAVLVLGLTAIAEYDYTGKSVTIFEMMLKSVEENINHSDIVMWINGCSGWLILLLPLLASFGYLVVLSSERQSGETADLLVRMGNFRYCTSKIVGGALAGGVGFTIGYGVFGIIMWAVFPSFTQFPPDEQLFYLEFYGASTAVVFVLKRLFGAFLYGMFASVFGIGVAIGVRDRYMLLCLPFLFNYIYTQMLQKILLNSYEGEEGLSDLISVFSMNSVMRVSADLYWVMSLFFMAVVYMVLLFVFYLEVRRRRCNG